MFEGRMRVMYADGEEVFEAGDAFYVSPGHTPFMEAGTEILVFSPKDEYRKTQEVAEANNEARQKPRKRTAHNPPWKAQKEGVRGDAVSAQGRPTRREVP